MKLKVNIAKDDKKNDVHGNAEITTISTFVEINITVGIQ